MTKGYYEVIVEGTLDLVKGFVLGYLEGSGIKGEAIFGEEHHVENESKFGQLMRLVRVKGQQVHMIVGKGLHDLLKEAISRRKDELKVKIVSVREIGDASFDFSYKAFKKELGEILKAKFGNLPEGLGMEGGYAPEEKVNPEGKGVETYAPLHEYELKAKGRIRGDIKPVIDFYGEIEHIAMVELGDIKISYSD
ncbi:MAG: hypothetical protein JW736_06245 [Deltaproteobacteria bacterium]|nr:hypothetical protein [Deltaproteobacteria bacterium]MBN2686681.1 hypothetical protein [Deltaproteobacteria bacterium]